MSDEVVTALRAEITAIDRELVALVNRRLETVARLRRHKEAHDMPALDPQREERMLADRLAENTGPLSEDGLRAFHAELLALTKRELGLSI